MFLNVFVNPNFILRLLTGAKDEPSHHHAIDRKFLLFQMTDSSLTTLFKAEKSLWVRLQ